MHFKVFEIFAKKSTLKAKAENSGYKIDIQIKK